jgi:hypothetical protein
VPFAAANGDIIFLDMDSIGAPPAFWTEHEAWMLTPQNCGILQFSAMDKITRKLGIP